MFNIIAILTTKTAYNIDYFRIFDTILSEQSINFCVKIFLNTDEISKIDGKTLKFKFISPLNKQTETTIVIDDYKITKGIVTQEYDIDCTLSFNEIGTYTYEIYINDELVYKNYLNSKRKE